MTDAPFSNCQFRECDLPGQCRSEGKCHHPRAAGASEGQAVGFMMKHKTGMDIGFAWKQDDPKFSADWIRIPLYLHHSAEIAALRQRIAGMEKDASGDRAAALERLRGFMAAYQEEWSDDNLNSLLDVIAMEKHP
jgi:hypothetical protein